MAIGQMPTRLGDVIILTKAPAVSTHVVCPVKTDGQQGCTVDRHTAVSGRPAAMARARSLVVPDGRIFLKDQDSGEWGQLSD